MPIYPYVCTECGHEFDALQKISEEPLSECPVCGKSSLRKRLAAPAFQLKGTGWYETDFKNAGKKKDDGKGDQAKDKETKSADKDGKKAAADKSDGSGASAGSGKTESGAKTKTAATGKDD